MNTTIAPYYTKRYSRWTEWKTIKLAKGFLHQYEDNDQVYTVWGYDGPEVHICEIWKDVVIDAVVAAGYSQEQNDLDKADFLTNYLSTANQSLSQIDTDGANIVRIKAAKRGWTYGAIPIEFQTSRLSDTLYSVDHTGAVRSYISMKSYNAQGAEVTTAGLLNANYSTIVKTIIDFEPPFDYEVIGGTLRTVNAINNDLRLWIIGVPDIAAPNGSKEMAGGINLKYLSPGNYYSIDGRVSKSLTYSASLHTNKLRFMFQYSAGSNEQMSIMIELYRS